MGPEQRLECTVADLIRSEGGSVKTGPFGTTLKADEYVSVGVPLVSVREIVRGGFHVDLKTPRISEETTQRLSEYVLQRNDIVFARKGSVERCALVSERESGWFLGSDGIRLRPPASIDARYLSYTFQSKAASDWLIQQATGSTMASLNQAILLRFPLSLPPLREQLAVSSVLGTLDDRIDLLRQTNTTLEAIAQALFKSWFVDFDPVHAKAEGRELEAMDAATAALFPSEFEESELGPIPEGWRVDEIGNVVKCLGGGTPSTKEDGYWVDGKHHWATPKDLAGLQAPILTTTSRKITDAGLSRISSGLLPRGTLLMSSRAPIGYLALAGIPTAINQGFIAMPPGGTLPPVYLFFWTGTNMDSIKQKANGSTFMEISKSAFRPIKLCAPSPELVDAFVAIASPLMDRIEANEHHRATLTELRDTLLPRLISGKLRLPETTEGVTEECVA